VKERDVEVYWIKLCPLLILIVVLAIVRGNLNVAVITIDTVVFRIIHTPYMAKFDFLSENLGELSCI